MDIEIENTKQQDILKTGKTLFWKHGVKRVSVEEICKEAGVSKMTFYKFYPNKIELAKAILDAYMTLSMNRFNEIVTSENLFSKKLEAIFLIKIEVLNDFSQEFINDIYTNQTLGLRKYLEEKSQSFSEEIKQFYRVAQQKGNIRKNVNIDFVMEFSTHTTKLMENKALMAQYNSPKDFILEIMNLLFYGITTGNE